MNKKKDKKIDILGTEYTFRFATEKQDEGLKNLNGYCIVGDEKLIVVEDKPNSRSASSVKKRTSRHEIIHAFLYESGLDNEAPWSSHEEMLVDWIAIQFPKMVEAMKSVDAL